MSVPITEETAFLLLACDGFWDVVSNDDAIAFVLTRLEMKGKPLNRATIYEIAIELTTLAFNNGSGDNISIILIVFEHSGPQSTAIDTPS